jgi:short subunit dehydrogenase-like uncharacterized protein
MKFDIIVFGATSFVGQILCRYLLAQYGSANLHWAIAARSKTKLDELVRSLAAEGLNTKGLKLLIADAADEDSLRTLCKQTSVIVSTVGPYALFGELLVKVCAEQGTDYCDLTGETPWVGKMISRFEATAKASGARIVHCCGFDSIPSDMGVWFLQQQSKKQFKAPCVDVKMRVKAMKGTASGGTVASLMNVVKEAAKDAALRKELANPYALCPRDFTPKVKQANTVFATFDKDYQVWTAPFVMAGVNTRIVFRSNALLNGAYDDEKGGAFKYDEAMMTGRGTAGRIAATQYSVGLGGFVAAAALKPGRWILEKFLPAPGEGPSQSSQDNGFYDLRFTGRTAGGEVIKTKVTGDKDPGYGSTAKMLAQAALCLLHDVDKKPGGFWTPASLFGNHLIKRLEKDAGLTFQVVV